MYELLSRMTGREYGLVLIACTILLTIVVARLATRFASRRGALRRLRVALDAMPEGLAFYDAQDRIEIWNTRYAQLVKQDGIDLRAGMNFRDLLRAGIAAGTYPEAAGREEAWIEERVAARKQMQVVEQRLNDGRWLRAEDRRTEDGGVVSICVDVTDLKRDAEALARARDTAQDANRAKSEFLANMSHEIRTPLNGVLGLAEVLVRSDLSPQQKEMVEAIRRSGSSLDGLLSDILDLARIESGQMEVRSDVFRLDQAVEDVAALYRDAAGEKGVALVLDIAAEAAREVSGDPVRLKQILSNLVSNAVKFTARGEVRIAAAGSDGIYRIEVRDTGVGFDPAAKDRLFQRFQQADGSFTRKFGGTGLGLAICKESAELLGGTIACDSTPGRGSTFTLTLPLGQADTALESGMAPTAAPALGLETQDRPFRVLIVDDNPTNRRVLEMILDAAGAERVSVENGRQAVDAYDAQPFDVVLMDIQMPVMDGITATRCIREHEGSERHTPVIMVSANCMPEHIAAGKAAGADAHLPKPISAAVLLETIAEVAEAVGEQTRRVA